MTHMHLALAKVKLLCVLPVFWPISPGTLSEVPKVCGSTRTGQCERLRRVLSPAPRLENHRRLLSYPAHSSQPSQRRNSQVGEDIAGAPGSGGYLPDSLEEGSPG